MIDDVTWLSGASDDYLAACNRMVDSVRFDLELDAAISLLRSMPEYGARVPGFGELRKIGLGRNRNLAFYYTFSGKRILVNASLDQRQDPDRVYQMLRSRGL